MGTFASYIGNVSIPEEKRVEFNNNMVKLLQLGGMIDYDKVNLYGKEIILIKPVEINEEGECFFHYNYFEDEPWENAGFDSNKNRLWSWKIGWNEFSFVICAGYILTELYSDDYGYAEKNGDILNSPDYVRWINFILDKEFSLERRFDLWKYYESYVLARKDDGYKFDDIDFDPFDFIPNGYEEYMGGTELADILYIANGTDTVIDEAEMGTYAKEVSILKNELERFYKENTCHGRETIWQLIQMPLAERKTIDGTDYDKIAEISTRVAARVFIYLSTEILGLSFWEEWVNLYENAYSDEVRPKYVGEDILEKRKKYRSVSLGKIKTSEFLRNDGYFTFNGTPEEIRHKGNYYISDDDLMYWWDGSDKIQLSDRMIKQISKWNQDYVEISKTMTEKAISKYDMLKSLIKVLSSADDYYKNIFSFSSMFYEFLDNSKNVKYIAAVKLFEKVVEDNKEAGRIIEHAKSSWSFVSKNVTFNEGRVTIKRFLSLMANKKLRKVYFGF